LIIPALVLDVSHSAAQSHVYAIGFCVGVVMFLYGLRRKSNATYPTFLPESKPAVPRRDRLQPSPPSPVSNVQIVRLSPETGTVKSADMTQQQKIAAALLKAGISNSPSWPNAEGPDPADDRSKVQVITAPSASSVEADSNVAHSLAPEKYRTGIPTLKKLMLWAGPALALLSLYLLLRSKSLL